MPDATEIAGSGVGNLLKDVASRGRTGTAQAVSYADDVAGQGSRSADKVGEEKEIHLELPRGLLISDSGGYDSSRLVRLGCDSEFQRLA